MEEEIDLVDELKLYIKDDYSENFKEDVIKNFLTLSKDSGIIVMEDLIPILNLSVIFL